MNGNSQVVVYRDSGKVTVAIKEDLKRKIAERRILVEDGVDLGRSIAMALEVEPETPTKKDKSK